MKDYDRIVDEMYPGVDLDATTRQNIIAALRDAEEDAQNEKEDDDLEHEEIDTQQLTNDFDNLMGKLGRDKCNVHRCSPEEAKRLLDQQMRRKFQG